MLVPFRPDMRLGRRGNCLSDRLDIAKRAGATSAGRLCVSHQRGNQQCAHDHCESALQVVRHRSLRALKPAACDTVVPVLVGHWLTRRYDQNPARPQFKSKCPRTALRRALSSFL
jgi:hypothetical protein